MSIRSSKLATAHPNAGGQPILFTVPPGETWLVKEILLASFGGADTFTLWIVDGVSFVNVNIFDGLALAQHDVARWDGWLAMGPGDWMQCLDANGFATVWVSGSKLLGVA